MWNNTKNWIFKILKKSEKYTKTDMVYLAKGGMWLGIGQTFSLCTTLLLSVLFANLISPESYGTYKYILSIAALLALPTLSGMDSAITRTVAQGYDGTIYKSLKQKLMYGSFTFVLGAFLSVYYLFNDNTILGLSFLIIAVCLPFWESFDIYNSLLNGKRLFGKYTYYYTYSQLLSFVFIASTIFITNNIILIIFVYYLSNTLIRILFFYKIVKETQPNDRVDVQAITYGKHLSLMDVIGTFLGQIDKILVFHYLGAIELARYSIAIAPTEQIKGVLKNFHTLALPKFSTRDKSDIRANIFQKATKLGLLVTLIIIVYILLAPYFFSIFFPKYTETVLYSQILSISLIGATVSMFLYTYLESHGEKKKLYQFNIFSNIVNSLIIFVSIYYFGLLGAIISRIIIRFLLLIISIVLIKQD